MPAVMMLLPAFMVLLSGTLPALQGTLRWMTQRGSSPPSSSQAWP